MARRMAPISQAWLNKLILCPKQLPFDWAEELLLGGVWDVNGYRHRIRAGEARTSAVRGRFELYLRIPYASPPPGGFDEMLGTDFDERSIGLTFVDLNDSSINLLRCNRGHNHQAKRKWLVRPSSHPFNCPHVHIATHWAMSQPAGRTKAEAFVVAKPRLRRLRETIEYFEGRCGLENRQGVLRP